MDDVLGGLLEIILNRDSQKGELVWKNMTVSQTLMALVLGK